MDTWAVMKNVDRYPGIDPKMPAIVLCLGTKDQAEELAERLSNWNAGCDHSWYVIDGVEGK